MDDTSKFTFATVVHEDEEEPYGLKITVNEGEFKGFEAVIFKIEEGEQDENSVAIDYYISKTPPEYNKFEIDVKSFEGVIEEGVNVFLHQLAERMEKEGFDPTSDNQEE